MAKLEDRLRRLDDVRVPDVWRTVQARGPKHPVEPPIRPARRLGTIALALVVAVAGIAFAVTRLNPQRGRQPVGTSSVTRFRFDAPPQPIAVGEGAAWVKVGAGSDLGPPGLWRIDATTGQEQRIDVPGGEWPAVGGGSAWLLCNAAECGGGSVLQLDPATGALLKTIELPGRGSQIAGTNDGVWITTDVGLSFVSGDGSLERSFPGTDYDLVGSDGTSVWVSESGGISKIDPQTGAVLAQVNFPDVCSMDVADSTVWIASCQSLSPDFPKDKLMGVDAVTADVLFREAIAGSGQMRFSDGVLWMAESYPFDRAAIHLVAFDPRSGARLAMEVRVPRSEARFSMMSIVPPHVFLAAGEGSLWVTDFGAGEVIRVDPGSQPSPEVTDPTPSPSVVVDRIGVYEAMIRRLADAGGPRPIYVLTTLCSLEAKCSDRLSPSEQRELSDRLSDLGPIIFHDPNDPISGRFQEIVLGQILERPDGLRVEGGSICGSLCGSGATYIVVPDATGYKVVGMDESYGSWVA